MIVTLKLLIFIETLQIIAFGIFWACLKSEARRLIRPMDLILALLIPIIGLFGHNKNAMYAFLFAVPLLSIGNPKQLVCRYLLILPLFPALLQSYIVAGVYIADISAIDAFNFGALIALALTTRGRSKSIWSIEVAVWIIFLISLLMAARGIPLNGVLRSILKVTFSIVPPFYLLAKLVSTRKIASDAIIFFAIGGFCNAIISTFETVRHWPLYQAFYQSLGVPLELSATLSIRAGMLRAQGAVADPTVLGLIICLPFVAMLALRFRFRQAGWPVAMTFFVAGMIGSQSRGAWIAAAGGLALYLVYERRTVILAAFAFVVAFGATAVIFFLPDDGRVAHLMGRSGQAEWTADYRKNLFSRGIEEITAHPFFGQTRAQLEVSMNDMRQGQHIIDFVNTHLTSALIGGLGAFMFWMIAWLTPLMVGWRMRRYPGAHNEQSPVALPFAMIGACFICLLFTSTIDRIIPVVMISMGMMSAFAQLARVPETIDARAPRATGRPRIARSSVVGLASIRQSN